MKKYFILVPLLMFLTGLFILFKEDKQSSSFDRRYYTTKEDLKIFDQNYFKKLNNFYEDQILYRDKMFQVYHKFKRNSYFMFSDELLKLTNEVVHLKDGYYILDFKQNLKEIAAKKGYNLSLIKKKYPDIKMYVYHIRRIEDTNVLDDDKLKTYGDEFYNAFKINLIPDIKYQEFTVSNFEEYQKYYYKTDYHYNHIAGYFAYRELINTIKQDFSIEDVKNIKKEKCFNNEFIGNMGLSLGLETSQDRICVYELENISNYDYFVEGIKFNENELLINYENGFDFKPFSDYDYVFGNNYHLRHYDFNQEDKPNILIFADSFINPIKTHIASHFNNTYIYDLRNNSADFDLDKVIKEKNISIIVDFKSSATFDNGKLFIPINE